MANPTEIAQSAKINGIKPIFTDGFLIGFRFKAKNGKQTEVKLEELTATSGLLEITFVDESMQQALGRFILNRDVAEDLTKVLTESIKKFDEAMAKGGLARVIPKQEQKSPDTTYR